MDTPPVAAQPHGGTVALAVAGGSADPASGDAAGAAVAGAVDGAGAEKLPARPVPAGRPARRIRRLDDPEILQRVLAGLINLP